jgi:hypothetical protein
MSYEDKGLIGILVWDYSDYEIDVLRVVGIVRIGIIKDRF